MTVQLLSADQSTVVAEVEVPDQDGFPTVGVIVWRGLYFVGPNYPAHMAMPTYIRAEGVVIE